METAETFFEKGAAQLNEFGIKRDGVYIRAESLNDVSNLRPVASASDVKTYTLYDAQGQVVGEVDAEGYLTETSYDLNGNLTQTKRYATALTSIVISGIISTTNISSIRPASNAADQTSSRTYDALNRISTKTNVEGTVTQYTYDNVGNLSSTTVAVGTSEARSNCQ